MFRIRNKFADLLTAYGVSANERDKGFVLSHILQPVTIVDHAREMVPPLTGKMFGWGPKVAAVVNRRAGVLVQCGRDICITALSTSGTDVRFAVFEAAFGAALKALFTTQSGSNAASLGPGGEYEPFSDVTYGTVTVAGDDGLWVPPNAPMPLTMNPYVKAGEWFWMVNEPLNTECTFGVGWVEFPLNDLAAQEHGD